MSSALRLAAFATVAAIAWLAACSPLVAQPVRMSIQVFGGQAEIEVRDLNINAAKVAIEAALTEMVAISRILDAETEAKAEAAGGLAALNAAAGAGPRPVDPRLGAALLRAQSFCMWSNGAFGPLGGALNRYLARDRDDGADALVGDRLFGAALSTAACDQVRILGGAPGGAGDGVDQPRVELASGSLVDLRGWARGFAVDRAMEVLREHGAGNAWVESGPVRRGIGAGPGGEGWLVVLAFPGIDQPIDQLWLRDGALAVILPLQRARTGEPPLVNQRTGRAVEGVVAVVAVSELAIDAEALAATMAILGLREGRMRIANLKPEPAALWLLGEGRGRPLRAEYRWAELPRVRKR